MFALAGIGNTVYHPADYSLLSHHVPSDRIGQAFSVHTFAGMLGSAVAPASLLIMESLWGWRGAFIGAGVLGLATAAVLVTMRDSTGRAGSDRTPRSTDTAATSWRLLLSAFKSSKAAGAYFGLTPRKYQSGETDVTGGSPRSEMQACAPRFTRQPTSF